ncbi:hypothetical protein K4749_39125 [Streptomyces sp. TRM72054]|uniref:thiamine pyrophosphate-dependent enzyme n=1 Tax=Streptomyces sp. TRM72054 TaxID=2870562 RepID=UPI001C8B3400|nr:thiamine pyrophosphate-dependent enzyme [Streptomyces sp. TRM72054]MBX9399399.1 hypothetical protein [Streptomyces sp. TRM72054]
MDPRHALAELLPLLPPTVGIVIGGGHASVTACQMVPAPGLRSWTCPSTDFGAIGQSLAVTLGACFSAPSRRIVHITGDGDLMMALGELHTAVRYHLPLTVIVLNDQGFGQERHQLGESIQRGLADHPSPDLAALAKHALNVAGYRIDGPSDLHHLKQAMQHPHGLVLVDIRTTPGYRNPASTNIAQALATM